MPFSKKKKTSEHKGFKFDKTLTVLVVLLSLFGLLMIYNASSAEALRSFNDKFHYLKDQSKWLLLGMVTCLIVAKFDYHHLYNLSPIILIGTIVLLLLVFVPGFGIKAYGAHRWLNFRVFTLQPSELAKIALIIYLSAWLSSKEKGRFLPFVLLLSLISFLVIIEPDLGTAIIIIATGIVIYFASGAPVVHFLALAPGAILSAIVLSIVSPYRASRLLSFINPNTDPLGSSYHIRQILISLGSGGLIGLGLGNSRQKYQYLPEATTDSIFAIISEETGFVGSLLLLTVFLLIFLQGIEIASHAPDNFGKLLAIGITSWFFIQTFINLFSMVAIVPLTGVPLPFISYGGSSLVVLMLGVGILLNISGQRKEAKKA